MSESKEHAEVAPRYQPFAVSGSVPSAILSPGRTAKVWPLLSSSVASEESSHARAGKVWHQGHHVRSLLHQSWGALQNDLAIYSLVN